MEELGTLASLHKFTLVKTICMRPGKRMCTPPCLSEVLPVKLLKQFHFQHVGECGLFFWFVFCCRSANEHCITAHCWADRRWPVLTLLMYIVEPFLFLRPILLSGRFCGVLGLYPQAVSQASQHLDHLGH